MGDIIRFSLNENKQTEKRSSTKRKRYDIDAARRKRIKEIMDLEFIDINVGAVMDLYYYCRNQENTPDRMSTQILIRKGILNKDGTIPELTKDAMFEIRTGLRPPWLR